MTPTTFLGKRYYIVQAIEEASCRGCVLEYAPECPQNKGPRRGMCDRDPSIILIHRTKKAATDYVIKRLEFQE